MEFIQEIARNIDLSFTDVTNMTYHLYMLDEVGRIRYGNDTLAKFIGANTPHDLDSISTYDLVSRKEADTVKDNNNYVLKQNKKIVCTELFTLPK